jgi:predicted dehydrogenase
MTARVRFGVVGAGMGAQYAAALAAHPDVELAAGCARTLESALRLGAVGTFTSYEQMLAEAALDAVVIATPNNLHHPMALAALEAGLHVACDKPLALNADEARELAARAARAGLVTFVPFTWRFLPAAQRIKELLDDGFVGRPYHVTVWYLVCGWGDPHGPFRWQHDAAQAGSGALGNLASHPIHIVDWWLGRPTRVCSLLATPVAERALPEGRRAPVTVDDTCAFLGELEDGTPMTLQASSIAHGPRVDLRISVHGSDGALVLENDWSAPDAAIGRVRATRAGQGAWRELPLAAETTPGATPFAGCVARMVDELVGAIRTGRPARPDFGDGVRVQEVLDAVLASAAARGWMPVGAVEAVR